MPVSATENAITALRAAQNVMWPALQPLATLSMRQPHRPVLGELERVREQVLQHLLQALGVGVHDLGRQVRAQLDGEVQTLAVRHVAERASSSNPAARVKRTPPTSTSILPDSILLRSRMSLISASRSVPEV